MALELVVNNPSVLRNEAGQVIAYRCGRCGKWLEVEVFTDKATQVTGLSVAATMAEHTENCEGLLERKLPLADRVRLRWHHGP